MKAVKCFKFVQQDMTSENGNVKWKIGKWVSEDPQTLSLCRRGLHATKTPWQSMGYPYGPRWFLAEAKGTIIGGDWSSNWHLQG